MGKADKISEFYNQNRQYYRVLDFFNGVVPSCGIPPLDLQTVICAEATPWKKKSKENRIEVQPIFDAVSVEASVEEKHKLWAEESGLHLGFLVLRRFVRSLPPHHQPPRRAQIKSCDK